MFGLSSLGIGAYKQRMPKREDALPGRAEAMPLRNAHHVHGRPLRDDFTGMQRVQFGMGCFWGAERKFWSLPGVVTTAVGYAGGYTPNADYREVCSGQTGHAEVVLVVYDPKAIDVRAVAAGVLGEPRPDAGHAPGQRRRHAIPLGDLLRHAGAVRRRASPVATPTRRGSTKPASGAITTEIVYPAPTFYYAEDEHQQYLAKNPAGYCGIGGTGVSCQVGTSA